MGKELSIVPYTGFMRNHAAFTLALLREFPEAQKFLSPYSTYPSFEDHVRAYNSTLAQKCDEIRSSGYIFNSPLSQATLRQALKVARYNSTVLIYGESGTGKEVLATIIHQNSERKSFPMVKINCAAIPEALLESELFGYEKGSFTGASTKGKTGLWETAQNGTLFLDEVGELPLLSRQSCCAPFRKKRSPVWAAPYPSKLMYALLPPPTVISRTWFISICSAKICTTVSMYSPC